MRLSLKDSVTLQLVAALAIGCFMFSAAGQTRPGSQPATTQVITTQPVATVTVVDNPLRVQAGWPVWLTADDVDTGSPLRLRVVTFDWGDYRSGGDGGLAAPYNVTVGYNSAHVFDRAGTYHVRAIVRDLVTRNVAVKAWVVYVAPNTQPVYYAANFQQLKQLAAAKPGSIIKATGPIDFPEAIVVKPNGIAGAPTIFDGQGNTARYTGATPGVYFALRNGGVRNWVAYSEKPNFGNASTVLNAYAHTFVINVTARQYVAEIASCKGEDGMLFQDNVTLAPDSLKASLVWVTGSNAVILGNKVANSAAEHCVRSGGTDLLCLNYNDFTNLDTRPLAKRDAAGKLLDPGDWHQWDFDKQSLTIHLNSRCVVAFNKFRGGRVELGPLGGLDGVTKPNWDTVYLRDVQFLNNDCDFTLYDGTRLEVDSGVDGFLIAGNTIRVRSGAPIVVESIDPNRYPYKRPDGQTEMRGYNGRTCRNGWITLDNVFSRLDGRNPGPPYIGKGADNVRFAEAP